MPEIISLAMAVYNREDYLQQAIDSILAQTYPHWQLEIWDDGSTDRSLEIARTCASNSSRINVVPGQQNIGHARVLAASTSTKTTAYLGWVDSDDWLAPTALAETIAVLEAQPEVGMVYTQQMLVDESGQELGLSKNSGIPYHHNRLLTDFLCHHFRLIRRSTFEAVGGIDPAHYHAEDYDLVLRISEIAKVQQIARPLYYYRQHPQSLSSNHRPAQIEASAAVVRAALVRRGWADEYELVIEAGKFQLVDRP